MPSGISCGAAACAEIPAALTHSNEMLRDRYARIVLLLLAFTVRCTCQNDQSKTHVMLKQFTNFSRNRVCVSVSGEVVE